MGWRGIGQPLGSRRLCAFRKDRAPPSLPQAHDPPRIIVRNECELLWKDSEIVKHAGGHCPCTYKSMVVWGQAGIGELLYDSQVYEGNSRLTTCLPIPPQRPRLGLGKGSTCSSLRATRICSSFLQHWRTSHRVPIHAPALEFRIRYRVITLVDKYPPPSSSYRQHRLKRAV